MNVIDSRARVAETLCLSVGHRFRVWLLVLLSPITCLPELWCPAAIKTWWYSVNMAQVSYVNVTLLTIVTCSLWHITNKFDKTADWRLGWRGPISDNFDCQIDYQSNFSFYLWNVLKMESIKVWWRKVIYHIMSTRQERCRPEWLGRLILIDSLH